MRASKLLQSYPDEQNEIQDAVFPIHNAVWDLAARGL
jgi:hypothetical protein